jgi:hypothetical protein
MADTIGRIIRRVAAGTASTSNEFADLRPLTSGAAQIWLTSDLNHHGDESNYRTLASIPGFNDILRPGPTGRTTDLTPADFDWFSPYATPAGGGDLAANACLGTHAIHRTARAGATWPTATLRCRIEPPANPADKLGYILVAVPGRGTLAAGAPAGCYVSGTVSGGGSWADLDVSLPLAMPTHIAPQTDAPMLGRTATGVPAQGELVTVNLATFWCAFFSTSGKCQAVAITLGLEP